MTFDYEAFLVGYTEDTNELGDPIQVPVRRRVLCGRRSITRSEHYQAAARGLKPEVVLVVNRYEYQGEGQVEFEGVTYTIERTYMPEQSPNVVDFETMELVCVGLVGE